MALRVPGVRGVWVFCCPNSGAAVASCGDLSLGGITYPFLFLLPFLKSCHRNTLDSPETLLKSISCIPGTSLLGQGLRLSLPVQGRVGLIPGLVANKPKHKTEATL